MFVKLSVNVIMIFDRNVSMSKLYMRVIMTVNAKLTVNANVNFGINVIVSVRTNE